MTRRGQRQTSWARHSSTQPATKWRHNTVFRTRRYKHAVATSTFTTHIWAHWLGFRNTHSFPSLLSRWSHGQMWTNACTSVTSIVCNRYTVLQTFSSVCTTKPRVSYLTCSWQQVDVLRALDPTLSKTFTSETTVVLKQRPGWRRTRFLHARETDPSSAT